MIKKGIDLKRNKVVFIAIPIVEQLQMFASIQSYLVKELNAKIDLAECVATKDVHVTIAYIGRISSERIAIVKQAINEASTQFRLTKKPVHLLWHSELSLYNNAIALTFAYDEGLSLLAKMTRQALIAHNIPCDERFEFKPHTTVARIKPSYAVKKQSIKRTILHLLNQEHVFDLDPIKVQHVGIYESGQVEPFAMFNCT